MVLLGTILKYGGEYFSCFSLFLSFSVSPVFPIKTSCLFQVNPIRCSCLHKLPLPSLCFHLLVRGCSSEQTESKCMHSGSGSLKRTSNKRNGCLSRLVEQLPPAVQVDRRGACRTKPFLRFPFGCSPRTLRDVIARQANACVAIWIATLPLVARNDNFFVIMLVQSGSVGSLPVLSLPKDGMVKERFVSREASRAVND